MTICKVCMRPIDVCECADIPETAFQDEMCFDGSTYESQHDRVRLTGQLLAVYSIMCDGYWHTLSEIRNRVGRGTEAAISARLRDLRKERFGRHTVERQRKGFPYKGLFEYRLIWR